MRKYGWLFLTLLAKPVFANEAINIAHTMKHENFDTLLTQFAKQQGLTVNSTWVDQKVLKVRLLQNKDSFTSTDMVILPADHLGLDKDINYSEIPASLISARTDPRPLETAKINNKLLGIPIIQGNHLLLYRNKRFLPESITDWQQLLAKQTQLPKNIQLVTWSFMEMYWFIPFLTAFDGHLFEQQKATLNTLSMQQALEYVWQLSEQGVVDSSCDYTCADKRFSEQGAAAMINGTWALNHYRAALGNDLAVQALPNLNGRAMQPFYSTFVVAFPNNSLQGAKQAQLKRLALLLQQDAFQQMIWQELHDLPVNTDVIQQLKAVDQQLNVLLAALNNTQAMPSTAAMLIVWEVLIKGFTRYGSGALSLQQATQFMQGLAERSIESEQKQ